MRYGTGVMIVTLTGLLWSTQGLFIRMIDSHDTWAILFWRCLGTAPVLFAYIAATSRGRPLQRIRSVGMTGVIGGAGLVFAFGGSIYAMQATTIANAVFLFSASPFFAAILGWIVLRERVRLATWAAIALALFGMFLMVREGLQIGALSGNIAAALSAAGFAVFTVTLRWGRLSDMLPAVMIGALMAAAVSGAVKLAEGASPVLSLHDAAIAMAIGAVHVGLGMVLYTRGSTVIPAAELTLLSMLEVLFAPVWVWLFLGETATAGTFIGGAVLMAAVAFNGLSGAWAAVSTRAQSRAEVNAK